MTACFNISSSMSTPIIKLVLIPLVILRIRSASLHPRSNNFLTFSFYMSSITLACLNYHNLSPSSLLRKLAEFWWSFKWCIFWLLYSLNIDVTSMLNRDYVQWWSAQLISLRSWDRFLEENRALLILFFCPRFLPPGCTFRNPGKLHQVSRGSNKATRTQYDSM